MGKLNQMTGTPWHVEKYTRQEDDSRRHRSRCVYYTVKSKHCSYRYGNCIGSAHCLYYKEDETNEEKNCVEKKSFVCKEKEEQNLGVLGKKVVHQKYGRGVIVKVEQPNVTILFESGKESKFNISVCAQKKILIFE